MTEIIPVLHLYCESCGAYFGCIDGIDEIPSLGPDRHVYCNECAPREWTDDEREVETVKIKEPIL